MAKSFTGDLQSEPGSSARERGERTPHRRRAELTMRCRLAARPTESNVHGGERPRQPSTVGAKRLPPSKN